MSDGSSRSSVEGRGAKPIRWAWAGGEAGNAGGRQAQESPNSRWREWNSPLEGVKGSNRVEKKPPRPRRAPSAPGAGAKDGCKAWGVASGFHSHPAWGLVAAPMPMGVPKPSFRCCCGRVKELDLWGLLGRAAKLRTSTLPSPDTSLPSAPHLPDLHQLPTTACPPLSHACVHKGHITRVHRRVPDSRALVTIQRLPPPHAQWVLAHLTGASATTQSRLPLAFYPGWAGAPGDPGGEREGAGAASLSPAPLLPPPGLTQIPSSPAPAPCCPLPTPSTRSLQWHRDPHKPRDQSENRIPATTFMPFRRMGNLDLSQWISSWDTNNTRPGPPGREGGEAGRRRICLRKRTSRHKYKLSPKTVT